MTSITSLLNYRVTLRKLSQEMDLIYFLVLCNHKRIPVGLHCRLKTTLNKILVVPMLCFHSSKATFLSHVKITYGAPRYRIVLSVHPMIVDIIL